MIYVEMEGLKKIESDLGMMKDKSTIALRAAINNAAKQINDKMVDGAYKKYIFKDNKKKDISSANDVEKAKTSKLQAKVTSHGPVNELLSFRVKPPDYYPGSKGAPKWIRAKATRKSKFEKIALRPTSSGDKYKGFVVRYQNGHMALAQRVPGKRMKSKPWKEALKSLLSPSIPKMEAMIYDEQIDDNSMDILAECIQEQVERFLCGGKK